MKQVSQWSVILSSGLGYLAPDWRGFTLATAILILVCMFSAFLFPESPMYLYAVAKFEQGQNVLKTFACKTGRQLDYNFLKKLECKADSRDWNCWSNFYFARFRIQASQWPAISVPKKYWCSKRKLHSHNKKIATQPAFAFDHCQSHGCIYENGLILMPSYALRTVTYLLNIIFQHNFPMAQNRWLALFELTNQMIRVRNVVRKLTLWFANSNNANQWFRSLNFLLEPT